MDDPVLHLLRECARADPEAVDRGRVASAAARVQDWTAIVHLARMHGLTPLVHLHLARAGVDVPIGARQELFAGTVFHRESNQAHLSALVEILEALDGAGIPAIVLKGAALGHVLYPTPAIRPLGDLDLLVDPRSAGRAQAVLPSVGFIAPTRPGRRWTPHHHLPLATRQRDGYVVQVEIHTDAMSHDSPGSLSWPHLTAAPQAFALGGRTAQALGHADMLHHLARHLAEPASLLRLIWIADLVGYATRYRREIDWEVLRRRSPFVVNALALAHAVTPLPPELLDLAPPGRADRLEGAGVAFRPLSAIATRGRPASHITRELFAPPEWWLHLHYGVPPDRSIASARAIRHPLRVARWVGRRVLVRARETIIGRA